ncbi:hypothetical protein [Vulcanisaeta sp. EB80]|uniref:hypothetical protein n=1 Tax=Vulcanisaeta sp. EB80 TaxID=1650660 RepID=UPI000C7E39C6|nr:hypothetical protein [Vulcanisaeta sp. EB80]
MNEESSRPTDKEPFYFKSYDKVIGIAHDIYELRNEIERLMQVDTKALEYHLSEGHIIQWLNYIGEKELASKLMGVKDPKDALEIINTHLKPRNVAMDKEPNTGRRSRRQRRSRHN